MKKKSHAWRQYFAENAQEIFKLKKSNNLWTSKNVRAVQISNMFEISFSWSIQKAKFGAWH